MACLAKLSKDLVWQCAQDSESYQGMARIVEIILINFEDIESVNLGIPVLKTGTKGYISNGTNNSIKLSVEKAYNEGIRDSFKVTINLTTTGFLGLDSGADVDSLISGQFAIAAKSTSGSYICAGALGYLEVTEVAVDSTGNGFVTATFATPDWQTGSSYVSIDKATYESFKDVAQ